MRTAYIKHLSPSQDNEKNQIYLGGGLDGVTNLFPAQISIRSQSESTAKRRSAAGQPKIEALLDFAWLDSSGSRHDAPTTRIIDYFQYPEVRMSGFLKGCPEAPDALRRDRVRRFGKRVLIMGTASDGKVIGLVLTERDDPVVSDFPDLPSANARSVFRVLLVDGKSSDSPAALLRDELRKIIHGDWHDSRINRGGRILPFSGAQGGGYTLEALLGVAANGKKAPDKHGFEIKSYSGERISLMTPTPDLGFQGSAPFRDFMERYGHPAQKGDGSRRFTGMHRSGLVNPRTGLELAVLGYDRQRDAFGEASAVTVALRHPESEEIAAAWSIEKLANCWNAKHANALYISFRSRQGQNGATQYRYDPVWLQGRGTDVWRLLRAIDRGIVFYDPADTIYADGRAKVRPQWRISARRLGEAMGALYAETSTVTV